MDSGDARARSRPPDPSSAGPPTKRDGHIPGNRCPSATRTAGTGSRIRRWRCGSPGPTDPPSPHRRKTERRGRRRRPAREAAGGGRRPYPPEGPQPDGIRPASGRSQSPGATGTDGSRRRTDPTPSRISESSSGVHSRRRHSSGSPGRYPESRFRGDPSDRKMHARRFFSADAPPPQAEARAFRPPSPL